MPRLVKNSARLVGAGVAEYDGPAPSEDLGAIVKRISDLSERLGAMGQDQMKAILDTAKQISLQSALIAKLLEAKGAERWTFTVTARDTEGHIAAVEARQHE